MGIFRMLASPPFLEPSPVWSVSSGAYDPFQGVWLGGPLPVGGTVTFRVTGHLFANVVEAWNTADVSAIGFLDPDPRNDSASDQTSVRTLAVTLSGSTVAATPPTTVVLTTTLANQATIAAENVVMTFSPPPGLTFSGNTGACTTPFPCALGTMTPSSVRQVTTLVELPQGYAGPDTIVFSVAVTTTTAAATSPNDTDQWTVGVIRPGPPAPFHVVEPCRILDTRSGGPVVANGSRSLVAVGSCGVPASARALALNVTAVQPTADGDLRLYPSSSLPPLASAINFHGGQIRANNAVIALGTAGDLTILADMATGSVHVILDVSGYFE